MAKSDLQIDADQCCGAASGGCWRAYPSSFGKIMTFHETDNLALTQHVIPQIPIWIPLWLEHADGDAA
jgi:hypothetical protein